jgi:uncharacterized protein (UPF0128 family)
MTPEEIKEIDLKLNGISELICDDDNGSELLPYIQTEKVKTYVIEKLQEKDKEIAALKAEIEMLRLNPTIVFLNQ